MLGEIAAKIGEIATGQLIEALKEVIRDFNKNLNEQFGENFKQLNEAVERIVVWQEQYRQQMDELADEFWIAAQSIEQTGRSVGVIAESSNKIAERSDSIVNCAERLYPILHTLNDQLETFSELRQRALDAFPLIENRLNQLTTKFSDIVQTAIVNSHASMERQRTALERQIEQLNQLTTRFSDAVGTSIAESHESMNKQRDELKTQFGNLETAMNAANQQLLDTIDNIKGQLDDVFEKSTAHITQATTSFTQQLMRELKETLQEQSKELGNIVERNREDIENHVKILNESLRQELANSLTTLAGHLESLSNGFVQNYTEVASSYTQAIAELRQLIDVHNRPITN